MGHKAKQLIEKEINEDENDDLKAVLPKFKSIPGVDKASFGYGNYGDPPIIEFTIKKHPKWSIFIYLALDKKGKPQAGMYQLNMEIDISGQRESKAKYPLTFADTKRFILQFIKTGEIPSGFKNR